MRFFFPDRKVHIPGVSHLKSFIELIFQKEKRNLDTINVIFCSDQVLLKLNKSYLNHNYLTDVLTFDLSESSEIKGEIYLSVDAIKRNSAKYKVSINQELVRVIFHGILHLCSYNDKSVADKILMSEREDHYLRKWKSEISREK